MDVPIEIDGFTYATDFHAFDTALSAREPGGVTATLQPWPLRAHLAALSAYATAAPQGLSLDRRGFAEAVLEHCGVEEASREPFLPLALWWAGGGVTAPALLSGGWYRCGSVRALLRPWSSGERFISLERCRSEAAGGVRFDLAEYLWELLTASVVALHPAVTLGDLDSASGHALLQAVLEMNGGGSGAAVSYVPDTPESARVTLRICRALGWTPSQVWATPAAELDRLLALLDRAESHRSPAFSRLAQHPDAVVIRIEDD